MKTLVTLFIAMIASTCGVMMTTGDTRTMFQYALFAVCGATVFVLITGITD